jgi:uncharacterized protein (TIGR03084 family)
LILWCVRASLEAVRLEEVLDMADRGLILDDLAAESQVVDDLVSSLSEPQWRLPTPAPGWSIAHQIGHLAWTDAKALIAVRTPDEFAVEVEHAVNDPAGFVDTGAADAAAQPGAQLLARWRQGRAELATALAEVADGTKIHWFGPPMSAASMITARLMETWAHGQDIADALGVSRPVTGRLHHICRFGVQTRDFAFLLHKLAPPTEPFRVELAAPDGGEWEFGPAEAEQRVTGSALDFCLLVTQRRHLDDTDIAAEGEQAQDWLRIAQAFAGQPGAGRRAGQFT